MAEKFQITIDCADPDRMVHFWAEALSYKLLEPPDGFDSWRAWYVSVGVPEEELGDSDCNDRLADPDGAGPRFWFQKVPEGKVVKNRIHLDINVSGGREVSIASRRQRVDAKVERLVEAGASRLRVLDEDGMDHYAVVMQDPEGNEFCVY